MYLEAPLTAGPTADMWADTDPTGAPPGTGCNFSNLDPSHAVCNITCCNFGDGCVIDFSTKNITPWRVMEPGQLALFGLGVTCETIPGILGNVLVIIIILNNSIMRNDINMFILNMAVADLITSAVLPSTFLVENIYQAYRLGPAWCQYGESVRLTLLLTSVLSISVISVDRLWGLLRPFHQQFRPITTRVIMLATWVVAAAVSFYPSQLTNYSLRQYADFLDVICEENMAKMKMYWWLIAMCLVWVPATILFACFLLIFIKLRHFTVSQKRADRLRFVPPVTRTRRRAVSLLFCMFVTFIVCWSPFLLYVLVYQYSQQDHDNGRAVDTLYYVSHFMMYLVPVINPLLYALMHENFRRAATVTCPWLPGKVKYKAFRTGAGDRVQWSVRGGSLPTLATSRATQSSGRHRRPPPVLRRAHTLAEFPPGGHQGGATSAPAACLGEMPPGVTVTPPGMTVTPPEVTVTPPGLTVTPPGLTVTPPGLTVTPPGVNVMPPGVTVTPPGVTVMPPGVTVTPAAREGAERRAGRLDDDRLRQVTLIWNALMEGQRDTRQLLSVQPLWDICEESESRKTSLRSSIDLGELIGGARAGANPGFLPG